jgi:hypothetical protein
MGAARMDDLVVGCRFRYFRWNLVCHYRIAIVDASGSKRAYYRSGYREK